MPKALRKVSFDPFWSSEPRKRTSVYGLLLFASTLFFGDEIRLFTYIRSLFRASQQPTLMGIRALRLFESLLAMWPCV